MSPGPFARRIPEGDDRERRVCETCGFIDYENPKVVVGAVVSAEDGRLVLCRRAIEPRLGFWTIPAGYLELNETPAAGAMREAWEEACIRIAIEGVLAVYAVPRISQVQIIHRARLVGDHYAPGPESLEVALFAWADIPWAALAFPTVGWALRHHEETRDRPLGPAFGNPEGEEPW